ncbi:MAG: LysR substrate-binding domain-containing protein [Chromatiales bacterium]|jgi:LysR family hydrogen peroxide-inducible transcriptional activator
MNLRDLKYFIAVSETNHFGRAAERCFVSQPTLSGQIKKLEEELGVTLFERTNRSVSITPIGEELLQHAKLIMEQANVIQQLSRAHSDPLAGPLRVGAIPTISPYLMPLVLVPLRQDYPQMKLVLLEETTDNLTEHLLAHQIDVALLATPVTEPELLEIPLFDEPFWLAHPRDHELYTKDEITRADLNKLDLLLLAEGHCLTHQVMDVCRIKDEDLDADSHDLRAASLETLLQLVGAGYGSTLVPALAVRGSWMTGSGIIARKLEFKDAYRTVRLVYRKTFPRQAAIEALAEVIRNKLPNTVRRIK